MTNKKAVLSRLEKLEVQKEVEKPLIITIDYGGGDFETLRIDTEKQRRACALNPVRAG